MTVDQFQIGSMQNFIYLITDGADALVVDPQTDLNPWESRLIALGANLKGVLLTHTHHDHIAGVPETVAKYKVPIYVHEQDSARLSRLPENVRKQISLIKDGQKIPLGQSSVEVLHTPGHSAGECCYLIKNTNPWSLFTGDTVFVREVGRTDFESGSTEDLYETLQRLKKLPAETQIYPGHDYGPTPTSTIGLESRESAAFLCRNVDELDRLP